MHNSYLSKWDTENDNNRNITGPLIFEIWRKGMPFSVTMPHYLYEGFCVNFTTSTNQTNTF
jgi:hypothetical protein